MYGANRPCQLCQLCITICFLITRHFVKVFLFFSWRHRVRLPLSHQCHLSLFLFKSQITPLRDRLSLSLFETHTHSPLSKPIICGVCVCVEQHRQSRCPAVCNTHSPAVPSLTGLVQQVEWRVTKDWSSGRLWKDIFPLRGRFYLKSNGGLIVDSPSSQSAEVNEKFHPSGLSQSAACASGAQVVSLCVVKQSYNTHVSN